MLRYQAEQQREQDSRGDRGTEGGSGADHRVNNGRGGKPSAAGGMYLDNYTSELYVLYFPLCRRDSDLLTWLFESDGPAHQQGPGISVTRTFKVGDQIMFRFAPSPFNCSIGCAELCAFYFPSRETVKSSVYGSHIAAPTMSLEEYGDQVKAEALEREERSQHDANSADSAARNGRR